MRIPFTSSRATYSAWPLVVTTNTLNVALLIGIVYIVSAFAGAETIAGYLLLAVMYSSGASTFLLPIAIILAIPQRTRRVGGLLFYLIASLWIVWLWLFAFTSLYQNANKWWALVGLITSLFSSGLGLFAVFGFVVILKGQWIVTGVIVGGAALCRVVSNLGKKLMGMSPSQRLNQWVMNDDPILVYDLPPDEIERLDASYYPNEPLPPSWQSSDVSQPSKSEREHDLP